MAAWQDFFLTGWAASGNTSTATFSQNATWTATATERIPSTATFAQVGTWQATGAERLIGSAAFSQSAGWIGTALSLNLPIVLPITLSTAFVQPPASVAATMIVWQVVLVWDREV